MRAQRFLDSGDRLGEGPVWDERTQALWWVDMHGLALKRYDGRLHVFPMAEPPGSIALARDGSLLLAMQSGVYRWTAGSLSRLSVPDEHAPGLRFNDGRCDRAGRFWVGTLKEPDFPPEGVLYRISTAGSARAFRSGIQVPNSICFSPDGRTMYFADSPRHKIWAFDYDAEAGEIRGERLFASPHPGFPDGSCVDADGGLWNAEWGAGRVVRYTPEGKAERVVEVPAPNPTCPCFGGRDLDTLYITSAGGAGVFAVKPGVKGLAESRFG
jgi:sugar lactone lactonase YvrE